MPNIRGGIAVAAAAAISIATLAALSGCGTANGQAKPADSAQGAAGGDAAASGMQGTRVITNLSQLSTAETGPASIGAANLVGATAALRADPAGPEAAQAQADRNLDRLYLSKQQHGLVSGGEARGAGDRTLLNAKARRFPEFSYALLNRTLIAAQELEAKKLQEHKLPDEIKPMILVAVITPAGRLSDISVEQHSGVGEVDRIIIDACKKGLWAANPPKEALAADGVYRMRVEGVVYNNKADLQGNYSYITHVGLALL